MPAPIHYDLLYKLRSFVGTLQVTSVRLASGRGDDILATAGVIRSTAGSAQGGDDAAARALRAATPATQPSPGSPTTNLTCRRLTLEPPNRAVVLGRRHPQLLTKREFDVLEMLVASPGEVLTHDHIRRKLWLTESGLAACVHNLRAKIGRSVKIDYVHGDDGPGYVLREPVTGKS